MLDCICGMVEKTKSALSSIQDLQLEEEKTNELEELVCKVNTNASIAIRQVRETALEDIRQAEDEKRQTK